MKHLWWSVVLVLCFVACQPTTDLTPKQLELAVTIDPAAKGVCGDLCARWEVPLVVAAGTRDICEQTLETVRRHAAGEIDGFDALANMLSRAARLTAADTILKGWEPDSEQTDLMASLQSHVESVQGIVSRWSASDTTSIEAIELLERELGLLEGTLSICIERAEADGLSSDSVQAIISQRTDSIEAHMQTKLPPSICDCVSLEEMQQSE